MTETCQIGLSGFGVVLMFCKSFEKFVIDDIRVEERCHLLFAIDHFQELRNLLSMLLACLVVQIPSVRRVQPSFKLNRNSGGSISEDSMWLASPISLSSCWSCSSSSMVTTSWNDDSDVRDTLASSLLVARGRS